MDISGQWYLSNYNVFCLIVVYFVVIVDEAVRVEDIAGHVEDNKDICSTYMTAICYYPATKTICITFNNVQQCTYFF